MTIKEMLEKRAGLASQARSILDKAEQEKREPLAEERKQFDDIMKDVASLKVDADNEQRLQDTEKELATSKGRETDLERTDGKKEEKAEMKMCELRKNVCGDVRSFMPEGEYATDEYRKAFNSYLLSGEARALQKDSGPAGGYLSAPQQFMAELIQAVDDQTFMRMLARVLPPLQTAESLGAPSLDNDPADPTWTGELLTGSEDSTMTFGKRELQPQPLAQSIKVSKTLLRRSAIGADSIVRNRLSYKIGIVQENGFLNGSGANEPLGIFTASDNGIGTGRDVSTGNDETSIKFDGLKSAKYKLKPQYRNRAGWIFHTDAVSQISKLKDGEGRYIWQASVVAGDPDRILNLPVYESQYAPNTFTTGLYVGVLGDFSNYWIVDSLAATIQVLVELYAATNQNGYISRSETDGMPVLAEAFSRVKLG